MLYILLTKSFGREIPRIIILHTFSYPTKHTFSIFLDLHKKAIKANDAAR